MIIFQKILEFKNQKIDQKDEVSEQIISILDEYIKPAVSSDGGNIEFDPVNLKKKLLK